MRVTSVTLDPNFGTGGGTWLLNHASRYATTAGKRLTRFTKPLSDLTGCVIEPDVGRACIIGPCGSRRAAADRHIPSSHGNPPGLSKWRALPHRHGTITINKKGLGDKALALVFFLN